MPSHGELRLLSKLDVAKRADFILASLERKT
jgi:hypothetical protein